MSLAVPGLARFLPSMENVEKVINGWKMSSAEANELRWVWQKLRQDWISLTLLQGMIVCKTIPMEWALDLLEAQKRSHERDELKRWQVPTFPINGNDLIALGYQPGPGLGDELNRRRDWWIASGYTMTREELLKPPID